MSTITELYLVFATVDDVGVDFVEENREGVLVLLDIGAGSLLLLKESSAPLLLLIVG